MAICRRCRKWSLFLKVDNDGLCSSCSFDVRMEKHAREEEERKRMIEEQRQRELKEWRASFPIKSENKDIQSIWSFWNAALHNTSNQVYQQENALKRTVPISINTATFSGYFLFSYPTVVCETTLLDCTCKYFTDKHLPCDHMYRLFHELSFPNSENEAITDVPDFISNAIPILASSSEPIWSLLSVLCDIPDNWHAAKRTPFISELIDNDFFLYKDDVDCNFYSYMLNKKTKDTIILSLAKRGIKDFAASWSKVKLIDWIINNHPEFLKKEFPNFISIKLSPDALKWVSTWHSIKENVTLTYLM